MSISIKQNDRLEVAKIKAAFPCSLIKVKEFRGDVFICLKREDLFDVIKFLKEDPELKYTYFVECLGADYSQWKFERDFAERFEVIYNLMSLKHYSRIFVKVGVDDGQKVPSLKTLYMGAEFPEREIWDLFGIVFEGNEQTQRFIMPDDWIGHPLRKDFSLGGEDVLFAADTRGPAIESISTPHAGESFEGKTGTARTSHHTK